VADSLLAQSTVTARLSAAGAVIVGKTNMVRCRASVPVPGLHNVLSESQDEFGMGSFNVFSAHGPAISPLVAADKPGVWHSSALLHMIVQISSDETRQGGGHLGAAAVAALSLSSPAAHSLLSAQTQARLLCCSDPGVVAC
jgi:Asp-tRNA(Asn)/Glu-tRNA(Gln) amidotransferase A subunit family amidase